MKVCTSASTLALMKLNAGGIGGKEFADMILGAEPIVIVLAADRDVAEQPVFEAAADGPAGVPLQVVKDELVETSTDTGRRRVARGLDLRESDAAFRIDEPVRRDGVTQPPGQAPRSS